jgi:hypothetical protein
MPSDELEMRRAVTADLREFAGTISELLTGKRDLGAGGLLPQPFREFVRASFGTEDCPSPTAADLIRVLNGEPLCPPVLPASTRQEPLPPPPPPPVAEPVRVRPNVATVGIAGVLVIALAVVAYRSIVVRPEPVAVPERARTGEARPSPVSPTLPSQRTTTQAARAGSWAVVAAAYRNYDAASKRLCAFTPSEARVHIIL